MYCKPVPLEPFEHVGIAFFDIPAGRFRNAHHGFCCRGLPPASQLPEIIRDFHKLYVVKRQLPLQLASEHRAVVGDEHIVAQPSPEPRARFFEKADAQKILKVFIDSAGRGIQEPVAHKLLYLAKLAGVNAALRRTGQGHNGNTVPVAVNQGEVKQQVRDIRDDHVARVNRQACSVSGGIDIADAGDGAYCGRSIHAPFYKVNKL